MVEDYFYAVEAKDLKLVRKDGSQEPVSEEEQMFVIESWDGSGPIRIFPKFSRRVSKRVVA